MGLSDDDKARYKALLKEAKVPERHWNFSLKSKGEPGLALRNYMKGEYTTDAELRLGAVFLHSTPGLAHSFTRDIVMAGASVEFYYLQTFANRNDETLPQSYVIEWFEQEADSPFTSKERFDLETRLMKMMDDEVILYLFTAVHPNNSKWWSRQFIDALAAHCRIIEVKDANRKRGEGTSFGTDKVQGSKSPRRNTRVTVR